MVTQIDAKLLQKEIEKQRDECLGGTIHVWSDSSSTNFITGTCNKYSGICENPSLFQKHTFSASTNPAQLTRELASCFPRLLVVALVDKADPNVANWVGQTYPTFAQKMPFADLRFININGISVQDRKYLESFGAFQNPTVLVFKMGHMIDSFVPPITAASSAAGGAMKQSIADQLAARNAAIKADLTTHVDIDADLRRGVDQGRDEWEQKEREKRALELRKEEEAKRKERLRVKARIEEQRKSRQGK